MLYSTYANIGKTRRASGVLTSTGTPTPRTRIYMNMSGDEPYMEGSEGMRNDGWSLLPTVVHSRRCPTIGASV